VEEDPPEYLGVRPDAYEERDRSVLQRHSTENLKQIFPEKELRGLSPDFHIHVSVSDSHDRSAHSAAGKYVDRSFGHKCGYWD
jgi:hypothetical protein